MLRAEPDALFVFGDNLAGWGYGGQAAEMRDEPNAIGVPTKRRPFMDAGAFFTDDDWSRFKAAAAAPFARLAQHLEAGGTVVWPVDGIGTGLARLPQRAPQIWAALERARKRLESLS
ncbi:DUF7831 domain-containing protein [Methylobacterium fujisawaense]